MKNYIINKVLLPVDFSELNKSAMKIAAAICKRQKAMLTLIHVIDKFNLNVSTESEINKSEPRPDLLKWYQNELKSITALLTARYNIVIDYKLEKGNTADVICNTACEGKYNMIVIGTHGTSGFHDILMGTTAFRIVKNALCPVLSIRGDWKKQTFEKIVYPIRPAQKVFERYNYLKPIIEQNKSELIIAGLADKNSSEQINETTFFIHLLKNMCQEEKIKYSSMILPCNNFAAKIVDTSNNENADLIVVSANLDYDLKEFYLGPFAQQIVNQAKCPVLSIRQSFPVKNKILSEEECSINTNLK